MLFDYVEACGVCGAPHSTCKPAGNTDSDAVGVTRGVIVRHLQPNEGRVEVPVHLTGAAVPAVTAAPGAAAAVEEPAAQRSARPARPARPSTRQGGQKPRG